MLEPQKRLSIYDVVRPPTGFTIDTLVICTYSASLDTVLSLPAAMLADLPGMGKRRPGVFTAVELAALKRVCERTLVFCQGGAILPADHLPPAIIEAERMVHEVKAPMGGAFHPKLWVMRFVEAATNRSMLRIAILSRNLTADRSITCWLNERGYRTRRGARFGFGSVHAILTNRVYMGQWIFNKRCAKTLRQKPEVEHIVVNVPPIVTEEEFATVAATLKSRDPRVTAPRVVTGPILLTGLAHCATCDGAMTLRTGTSKSGDVHKYYTCSTCQRKGKTACKGRSIPMAKLDALVTDRLAERLFQPERLTAILASVSARRGEKALEVDRRVATLRTEVADAEAKLKRLYKMVEEGVTDLDDILKDRLAGLKLDRDRATTALDRIKAQAAGPATFDAEAIERFGRAMRENITVGEISFRREYIRAVIDRIEVDDGIIRIIGDKSTLEQAIEGRMASPVGVRSFERKWRTR